MQASKILFSEEELSCTENSEWILTKNRIIKKIISVFAMLSESYKQTIEEHKRNLPEEVFSFSPKISRGEQYLGLPYVMLDYPRIFSKDDVFAIRTFFWWGNYFSLTLHLKGKYKTAFQEHVWTNGGLLSKENYYVGISDDEWRHDFEEGNYVRLQSGPMDQLRSKLLSIDFLKLAIKWPLKNGNEIDRLLKEQFTILLQVITG